MYCFPNNPLNQTLLTRAQRFIEALPLGKKLSWMQAPFKFLNSLLIIKILFGWFHEGSEMQLDHEGEEEERLVKVANKNLLRMTFRFFRCVLQSDQLSTIPGSINRSLSLQKDFFPSLFLPRLFYCFASNLFKGWLFQKRLLVGCFYAAAWKRCRGTTNTFT